MKCDSANGPHLESSCIGTRRSTEAISTGETVTCRGNIRVLIADPEAMLLEAYDDFLSNDGFDVATAATPHDCLARLGDWKPDVLVMEPETPDGWGERILRLLVDHPELRRMPVIVLTRGESNGEDERVKTVHMKPVKMARLSKSIRDVVLQAPRVVR